MEGETEAIEGYKVRFIWKKHNLTKEERSKIKRICIQVFKDSKAYGDIPNVGFVIEDGNSRENPGWVKGKEVSRNKSYLVHLNYEFLSRKWENKDEIRRTITHELIHLWDYHNHLEKMQIEVVERLNEIEKEIESEFKEMAKKLDKEKPVTIQGIRSFITLFLHSIRSEGIALNLDGGINFEYDDKEEAYIEIREEAKEAADFIRDELSDNGIKEPSESLYGKEQTKLERIKYGEELDEVEEAIEELKVIIYGAERQHSIGKHVVHSIRLSTDMNINEIANLGPRELIKTYENAESNYKHDWDPVISLNSGQGIIDYNRMIKKIGDLFNELSLLKS